MIDWSTCPAVEQVPGKVSGAWVFTNTRVPLSYLFANPYHFVGDGLRDAADPYA